MELLVLVIVFGLLVGSYLNVVIYRVPMEISTVAPRSHCTSCGELIPWFSNIPVVSFLFQGGECRHCKSKISLRYPAIEVFTSMGITFLFLKEGVTPEFVFQSILFCLFLCQFMIDLDHQLLPDKLNLLILLTLLIWYLPRKELLDILLGAGLGFLFPALICWVFFLLRGQIGMGGGDIKLFGALGVALGPFGIMRNLFLSSMLGAIIGGLWLLFSKGNKNKPIPFGPFIILTAALQIFFPLSFKMLLNSINIP